MRRGRGSNSSRRVSLHLRGGRSRGRSQAETTHQAGRELHARFGRDSASGRLDARRGDSRGHAHHCHRRVRRRASRRGRGGGGGLWSEPSCACACAGIRARQLRRMTRWQLGPAGRRLRATRVAIRGRCVLRLLRRCRRRLELVAHARNHVDQRGAWTI